MLNNALQTVASPLTLCPLNESQLVSVFLRWLHEGCMVLTRAMHLAVRRLQPDGLMLLLSIPYPLDVWCSTGMYVTGICINVLEHRDLKSCWWKCMTADTAKRLNGHSCIHARLFFFQKKKKVASSQKPQAPLEEIKTTLTVWILKLTPVTSKLVQWGRKKQKNKKRVLCNGRAACLLAQWNSMHRWQGGINNMAKVKTWTTRPWTKT